MDDDKLTIEDELLLQAYVDDELPSEQRRLFAERLNREPILVAVLGQWHALTAELESLPEPQLTRDLTMGVLARLAPPKMQPIYAWRPLLVTQVALAFLTALLAWPLLASWTATSLTPPDWTVTLRSVWSGLVQEWMMWWTANVSTEVWLTRWTAVWQGLDPTISISLSVLLPLAVLAVIMWLVSLRFIWRSSPVIRFVKG